MDQLHSIVPPPELVQQWFYDWYRAKVKHVGYVEYIATQSANRGDEQRLKAVCEWLDYNYPSVNCAALRVAMRPKPPSLAEEALTQLDSLHADLKAHGLGTNTDTIRRALEQLDD